MAQVSVSYQGGAAFKAECRSHSLSMDQSVEKGGTDAGFTPPELFAASLAGCIGHYVAAYCNKAGLSADGLKTLCDWHMAEDPYRIGNLDVRVVLPGLPEKRRKAVERVAESCLLHATLLHSPVININVSH